MRAVGERTEAGGSSAPARKRSLTSRGVLGLQHKAGNSAVARLILQRRASSGAPPAPVGLAPRDDPRFRKVEAELKQTNKTLTSHPPATAEANKAAAAAEPPGGDRDAQAKAAKADKMAGAKPGGFDKAAFMAAVRRAIAAKAPQNLDDADKFATSGAAGAVKSDVMANVTGGKEASAKDIATKTAEAPDPSKARDKPVTPLKEEPAPKPPVPNAAAAMPTLAPPEQTQLDAPKHETDAQMAEAGVTEKQLAESNEPEFTGAVAAKKAGEQHSATAPGEVREAEAQTLQNTAQGAGTAGKNAVGAMIAGRGSAQGLVSGDKSQAKAQDEAARSRITADINRLFDATKTEVDGILNGLDASVAQKFDAGAATATATFEADHKARMQRYKDVRYEGWEGAARWTADLFAGLPKEANDLFLESKKLYESKMDQVISEIADHIGAELGKATERIAKGRKEISGYVASQPKELQKVAKDCAGDVEKRLGQLQSDVDAKGEALVDDLATRYSEARDAIDTRIQELQDANKGLWDKAKEAVGGAIETILKLKDMLLGVLARAAGAIDKIISDPIGFLGKLVNAVRGGVTRFASNIVSHLKKGLQGWLFGTLASAGIEIPDTFDLRGVIKLVLSILGLTWTRIRTKIVARIGDAAMNALESGVDIFKTLVTQGIGGLWTFLVDKLSDLKDTVMSAIQDFVVVKIVKAGITWLISALNPAAAFIKACKMIYDVVMFFVEKGSQIKEFVDSVLDSIEEIAGGAVGRVAGFIENTLAKILPLLIGFLASLLGLGGISEKIKEILQKVQEPVSKAVDFVINGALKLAAPVINLAKRGVAWVKGKYEKGKAWVKGKYEKGKAWVKEKATAVGEALGIVKRPVTIAGESHTLSVDTGTGAIRMASVEEPIAAKVAKWVRTAKARGIPDAEAQGARILAAAQQVSARIKSAKQGKSEVAQQQLDQLAAAMADLVIKLGGAEPPTSQPRPDGLGNVSPHGSQVSSNRNDVPERWLESEHVIPVSWVSLLFDRLGDVVKIVRGKAEDNRLHTVMIYKGAASQKTHGAEAADNLLINQLKSLARRGTPTDLTGGSRRSRRIQEGHSREEIAAMESSNQEKAQAIQAGLLAKLPAVMAARVQQTMRAIRGDNTEDKKQARGHDEPLPAEDRVRAAAQAEAQDIANIFLERVEGD